MEFDITALVNKGIEYGADSSKLVTLLAKAVKNEWDIFTTFMLLYKEIFGRTLCKEFCNVLVDNMHHGTNHGRKWTVEQTNELAKKNDIEFGSDYTEFEFNAAVHMMWYDYHEDLKESGVNSDNIYAKFADSYLSDEDSPKGKLVNYFFFVFRNEF